MAESLILSHHANPAVQVEGEPSRLVAGQDYKGRTCGHSDGVKDMPRIMYPRTNEDLVANLGKEPQDYAFYGICVEQCNTKDTQESIVVVCNEEQPGSAAINEWPSPAQDVLTNPVSGCFGSPLVNSNAIDGQSYTCAQLSENCWVVPVFTSSILTRCIPVFEFNNTATATCAYPRPVNGTSLAASDSRCVLVTETSSGSVTRPRESSLLFDQLNDASQTWGRYINDLRSTWWVIVVCAIVIGLVLGYMFLFLIKYCVGIVVWLTIIFTLLLSVALTAFLYFKAGVITSDTVDNFTNKVNSANSPSAEDGSQSTTVDQSSKVSSDSDNEQAFRVAAYIMTGITIIILVMVIALRKSISVAIDVIKLGAEAVNALSWEALVAPIIPVLLLFALLAYWLFVTVALFSVPGTAEESTNSEAAAASANEFNGTSSYTVTLTPTNQSLRYMIIYAFFGLLWTNQFLVGMTIMMLGGAVAGWYFSKGDESVEKAGLKYEQPALPVFTALWRAMKFHMGSVAVGSFLIATVQFIRAVMYYIEQQARKGQENNRLIKLIFMCIQCILWCIECILKVRPTRVCLPAVPLTTPLSLADHHPQRLPGHRHQGVVFLPLCRICSGHRDEQLRCDQLCECDGGDHHVPGQVLHRDAVRLHRAGHHRQHRLVQGGW